MHSRNLHVNERIRTALKAAGIIVGYDHTCRRCRFEARRSSSRDEVPGVRLRPLGLAGPEWA
jgi:hypothetical protein